MKTQTILPFAITIAIISMFTQPLKAQSPEKIDLATKNYVATLESNHTELMEDCFINILQMAQIFGTDKLATVQSSLREVSLTSNNSSLRFKAYLTLEALSNLDLLNGVQMSQLHQDEVYRTITQQLSTLALHQN